MAGERGLLGKADESSSDSGRVVPTWINLTLSSELLSFPDEKKTKNGELPCKKLFFC